MRMHLGTKSALVTAAVLVIAFQNCGEMKPYKDVMALQLASEERIKQDQETIERVLGLQGLKVWISASDSDLELSAGTVSAISGLEGSVLDFSSAGFTTGPVALKSKFFGKSVFKFNPGAGVAAAGMNSRELESSTYTMLMLVEGIPKGRLVTLTGTSPEVHSAVVSYGEKGWTATHSTRADNHSSVSTKPKKKSHEPVVIAITFTGSIDGLKIMVDGEVVNTTVAKVGSPQALPALPRRLILGGDSATSMQLAEFMLFTDELSDGELNTLSRYIADRWRYTGVAYNPDLPEADELDPQSQPTPTPAPGLRPSPTPTPVSRGAALYATHCQSCHSPLSSTDIRVKTKVALDRAIGGVGVMKSLSTLTSSERQAIVDALK